jgi:serine/threonine-protein kinase
VTTPPAPGGADLPASRSDWQEAFALLGIALELDPSAHDAWFESLGGDRARLEPMLRRLLHERSVLRDSDFPGATPSDALGAATPSAPDAFQLVGPYRLLREIGQGGMASVWLAERADGLIERRVALKLPHASWGARSFAERMARERNILASLTHPNIARLCDAGIDAGGRPFLALEYVDGQAIDTYAAAHDLSTRARVGLIVQVARAVAHAHAQLVVHRDLKPSNILVDAQGRAHLLDFGIAKLIDPPFEGGADSAPPTLAMARALTPDYASPEQIRGEAVGTASDLYSLGVVSFELLTGARPYRLKSGTGALALAESIARANIPRASDRCEERGRELRGDLDAILAKALARNAAERYASIDAFADDLERHLRGEPVQARAPSRWYVAERWVRRHPLESGIALALVLGAVGGAHAQVIVVFALGAGALLALWQRNRAVQQAELARAALERGEQVKNFIASIFTQAVPRAGHGGAVAATDLLRAAARRVQSDLAGQPAVAAELSALIGASFNELGDVRAGLDWLPRAVELCTRELGQTHRLTLQSRRRWVEAANSVGELDVSERLLPALVRDLRAARPEQPELLVSALQSHAFVHTKRGREAAAMAALDEAVEVATRRLGETSDNALAARAALSNTFIHFGRPADALQAITPALEPARSAYGTQRPHPILSMVERCLADALAQNQRPRDAALILEQVLVDQRALDTDETHRVRVAMSLLAKALLLGGHFAAATELYERAATLHEQLTGGANDEGVGLLTWLGLVNALRGNAIDALAHLDRADALRGGRAEADVLTRARGAARALALAGAGRNAEALAATDALLDACAPRLGTIAVRLLRVRAMALRQSGSTTAACSAAAQALAAVDAACLALEHGLALDEAARCSLAADDPSAAQARWREALDVWERGQVDGPVRASVRTRIAEAPLGSP